MGRFRKNDEIFGFQQSVWNDVFLCPKYKKRVFVLELIIKRSRNGCFNFPQFSSQKTMTKEKLFVIAVKSTDFLCPGVFKSSAFDGTLGFCQRWKFFPAMDFTHFWPVLLQGGAENVATDFGEMWWYGLNRIGLSFRTSHSKLGALNAGPSKTVKNPVLVKFLDSLIRG